MVEEVPEHVGEAVAVGEAGKGLIVAVTAMRALSQRPLVIAT